MSDKKINPNGVYFAYDKRKSRNQEDFIKDLTEPDNILHINKMKRTEETGKDTTYIICMTKDKYEMDKEKLLKEKGIVVKKFFNSVGKKLPYGSMNGYFVSYETSEELPENERYQKFNQSLVAIIDNLVDGKFIEKESVEIIFPPSYPDGKLRHFAIINFKSKNKNRFITPFVNKLKYMLDGYEYDNICYHIKWLSQKVFEDIKKGENKEIKVKAAASS